MRRLLLVFAVLASPAASAERGLFAFSLVAGPTFEASSHGAALTAAAEYGVSERWGVSLAIGGDFNAEPAALLGLGPRVGLYQGDWLTLQLFLLPEAMLVPSSSPRLDLGLELGISLRYQLLWGLGVAVQAGARGRTPALDWSHPQLQAVVLVGLFIEA